MTTFGFGDCKDPVAAHQHINGGGWVADTATVADTAYVGPNAKVYGIARVSGNATVSGDAMVLKTPPRVSRSDGYDFIVVPCADNQCRVIAGCRYFTFDEAYEHWNKNHSNYDETVDILDYLKKRRKKSYVDSKSD